MKCHVGAVTKALLTGSSLSGLSLFFTDGSQKELSWKHGSRFFFRAPTTATQKQLQKVVAEREQKMATHGS